LFVVQDGGISSAGGLTFFGKKYPNYGKLQNENFLKLLENFSNSTAPTSPLEGQLWWDSANKSIKIYHTTQVGGWVELPTAKSIVGTVNQIAATVSGKTVTLSLPQSIHTAANPTFNRLSLGQNTGTAPIDISSTTLVVNLNSDLLDGNHGSYYLNYNNFTNKPLLGTISSQDADNVSITGGSIKDIEPLPIASGGTAANDVASARTNLGLGTGNTPEFTRLTLSVESGTAPLTVASDTVVTNLNADLLDGKHGSYYLDYSKFSNTPTIGNGTIKIESGGGLSGSGQFLLNQTTSSTITISHGNTSSVENVSNTNGNVIQSVGFDTYGHVTSASSVNLDNRYYTKTSADQTFLKSIGLASSSTIGGIKMRLSGNVLYIRNDGANA
jgi:hypothetical protein